MAKKKALSNETLSSKHIRLKDWGRKTPPFDVAAEVVAVYNTEWFEIVLKQLKRAGITVIKE